MDFYMFLSAERTREKEREADRRRERERVVLWPDKLIIIKLLSISSTPAREHSHRVIRTANESNVRQFYFFSIILTINCVIYTVSQNLFYPIDESNIQYIDRAYLPLSTQVRLRPIAWNLKIVRAKCSTSLYWVVMLPWHDIWWPNSIDSVDVCRPNRNSSPGNANNGDADAIIGWKLFAKFHTAEWSPFWEWSPFCRFIWPALYIKTIAEHYLAVCWMLHETFFCWLGDRYCVFLLLLCSLLMVARATKLDQVN